MNYVKTKFFKKHTVLLFYCNSRWLSKVLVRIFELIQELKSYLSEESHNYSNYFIDSDFVIKLAYLYGNF